MLSIDYWKDIPGWEGYYQASYSGLVRRIGRVIKHPKGLCYHKGGFIVPSQSNKYAKLTMKLCKDGKSKTEYLHQIIALTFIGQRPRGMECCHNNGYSFHNCVPNLRYDTHAENMNDMIRHGSVARGSDHSQSRLTEGEVRNIKSMLLTSAFTQKEIAQHYGVCRGTISAIKNQRTWWWLV